MTMTHIPVLSKETIEGLQLKDKDIVVDATFGLGGHSREVCQNIPSSKIIGIDLNDDTRVVAEQDLKSRGCNVETLQENFRNIDKVLTHFHLSSCDKYIFDLGWSSAE